MGFFKKSDLKKNYEIGDQLGSGNFAVVKKAINKQKDSKIPKEVAIKIIDKAKVEDMGDITREIEIMQDISHPNVINLFEIFDEHKKMNLVMELVTGGELFDRIVAKGSYSEKDAAQCLKELCSARSSTCTRRRSSTATSSPRTCCTTARRRTPKSRWPTLGSRAS